MIMPHLDVLKTHMEFGFFIVLLSFDGSNMAIPLSPMPKSQSKDVQIHDTSYKDYWGSFKSGVELPNRRKLLSSNNESNSENDNSIGAKIREFYADDNNMALFCILPLLILIYGGCSVIYCIHKCKKNFKKKKQERKQKSKSQAALSSDNVSLISGTENMLVRPKDKSRFLPSNNNRVGPAHPYESPNSGNVAQKLKLNPNNQVKDLLTDYEFFASWVMAQKAADLLQLQGENADSTSSLSRDESVSRNYGTTVAGRKKKLVFLS